VRRRSRVAYIAWRKLGTGTRSELKLRAAGAGSMLLGNPVAYRVLVLKDGDGPGIEVHSGPSTVSQCTVVGIRGDAFRATLTPPDAGTGDGVPEGYWGRDSGSPEEKDAAGDDPGEDGEQGSGEQEDQGVPSETEPVPNVVPAVCVNLHASYPARFIHVRGSAVYTASSSTSAGSCPECGEPRAIWPGIYRAGADGIVTRSDLPGD
jgi:hypothetical protein